MVNVELKFHLSITLTLIYENLTLIHARKKKDIYIYIYRIKKKSLLSYV